MKVYNLEETNILKTTSEVLLEKFNIKFEESNIENIVREMFEKVAKWTNLYCFCSNGETVAMRITNSKSDKLILAFIISYHKNEDGPAGNYTLSCTTNNDDLSTIKSANIYHISNVDFKYDSATILYEKGIIGNMESHLVSDILTSFMEAVTLFLEDNVYNHIDGVSVELDGYFIIASCVEDGNMIFSFTPGSVLKRLAKNDESLEAKNE